MILTTAHRDRLIEVASARLLAAQLAGDVESACAQSLELIKFRHHWPEVVAAHEADERAKNRRGEPTS